MWVSVRLLSADLCLLVNWSVSRSLSAFLSIELVQPVPSLLAKIPSCSSVSVLIMANAGLIHAEKAMRTHDHKPWLPFVV